MAAGPWQIYGNAIEKIVDSTVDLEVAGRCRLILVISTYNPSIDADDTYSDLSAHQVASLGGYSTYGKALTNVSVTRSGGTITIDCDDQMWTNSSLTAKYAVIVRDANSDGVLVAGDLLIAYCDLNTGGGSVTTINGTIGVTIASAGICTVARAA